MTSSCRAAAMAALALAACGPQARPSARPAPAGSDAAPKPALAIRGARIFDGEKSIGPGTVVIRGEEIAAVGPDVPIPDDAEVVDATGKTLLPGFIDSHIHVWDETQLHQAAVLGVTTVLDMLTQPTTAGALRKAAGSRHDLADVRSAGFAATAPGGHGTEYGFEVPTLRSPEEAQAFVDARIAEGSDYIKIIYDDESAFGFHIPTLDRATMSAVIQAAHRRKKMAVMHIGSQKGARDAIAAGVDGLAHIFADSAPTPDFAGLVARHHAFVCPTLSVTMSASGRSAGASLVSDPDLAPYLSAADIGRLRRSFPQAPGAHNDYANAVEAVRALHAAGVPLLAGTDAPNPGTTYGASLHGELELLAGAGLTPTEALAAATATPASVFHLSDRGRIRPGLRADLLLVDGDPTRDIRATRRIAGVWLRGVRVDRDGYRAELDRARAKAAAASKAAASAIGDGSISDFDDLSEKTRFGAGWAATTDALVGGTSTAKLEVVAGGAHGSAGALRVSGTVVAGAKALWAGAMFSPGPQAMAPADLSSKTGLSLAVRGDGKTYSVMLFSKSRGPRPAVQTFTATSSWKVVKLRFADFENLDRHDILGIAVVATTPGPFELHLDDVNLD